VTFPKNLYRTVLLASFAASSTFNVNGAQSANTKPSIIPAPQEWTASSGHFDITSASLTCPDEQLALLKPVLEQFSQDLVIGGIMHT
jgi:hypothetical protein